MKLLIQTTVVGFIILTCVSCSLIATGMRESSAAQEMKTSPLILCRGTVFFTGSEPHVTLMIRSDGGDEQPIQEYALSGSAVRFLRTYQQEPMIVVGTIKSQKLGPGFPSVLEVLAYQDPAGTWFDAQGTLLDLPGNIVTDDQVRGYFSSHAESL